MWRLFESCASLTRSPSLLALWQRRSEEEEEGWGCVGLCEVVKRLRASLLSLFEIRGGWMAAPGRRRRRSITGRGVKVEEDEEEEEERGGEEEEVGREVGRNAEERKKVTDKWKAARKSVVKSLVHLEELFLLHYCNSSVYSRRASNDEQGSSSRRGGKRVAGKRKKGERKKKKKNRSGGRGGGGMVGRR
eukprot:GHVS01096799.1.p1 GENE.GHVS01096799.1~~GHVS01096799.1.p1  ORF type:complete len:190 (+),score=70.02 GHVS01096799.1:562-1131(+)